MTVTNFPNALPNFSIGFQGSKKLDPRITFTRATTATETGNATGDVSGVIRTFPQNVPRLTNQGLLIEPSRTNIQLDSANPITSGGQFITWVTGLDAPDDSTDAVRIVATAVDEVHNITSTIFPAAMPLTNHAWSCFARPEGVNRFTLRNPALGFCTFDLRNEGTVINPNTEPAYITPVGNGWYRCTVTGTPGTVSYQYNITLNADDETGFVPFLGDGTSGIRFWGWQMEATEFNFGSTSYIPTTTAAVTRTADLAEVTGGDFTNFYNTSASTWIVSGIQSNNEDGFQNAPENPFVDRFTNILPERVSATEWECMQAQYARIPAYTTGSTPTGVPANVAVSFDTTGSVNMAVRGVVSPQGAINPNYPGTNTLQLGRSLGQSQWWNGTITQLTYYPTRLSDDALVSLTETQT